jgi:hypothetical protein
MRELPERFSQRACAVPRTGLLPGLLSRPSAHWCGQVWYALKFGARIAPSCTAPEPAIKRLPTGVPFVPRLFHVLTSSCVHLRSRLGRRGRVWPVAVPWRRYAGGPGFRPPQDVLHRAAVLCAALLFCVRGGCGSLARCKPALTLVDARSRKFAARTADWAPAHD